MAEAESRDQENPRLDDVILYLLAKEASEDWEGGFKISISDVHQVLGAIGDDLQSQLHIPIKFQESSGQVYSQQIESALGDIIPYKIPVRNPSFSLEISDRVARMALRNASESLSSEQKEILDRLFEDSEFQSRLDRFSKPKGR